jgi:hypothetical protein
MSSSPVTVSPLLKRAMVNSSPGTATAERLDSLAPLPQHHPHYLADDHFNAAIDNAQARQRHPERQAPILPRAHKRKQRPRPASRATAPAWLRHARRAPGAQDSVDGTRRPVDVGNTAAPMLLV